MKIKEKYPLFTEGPRELRSTLFWAWNDKLERDELGRQIKLFKEAGLSGFFMHSRDGLETSYLGETWDDCIEYCVQEAEKHGLKAWLFDEDRWPSGSCGGKVSALEEGLYALKGLTLEVCHEKKWTGKQDSEFKAAYAARINGHEIDSYRRLESRETATLKPGETLLIVRFETSGGSDWFNGSAPPDNLNPETVKHFIDSTHEHYASYLQSNFGKTVPGIFTDEPSLADRHALFPKNRGWIPWSFGMEEFYEELGYGDIYQSLPNLYFNGVNSPETRFRYWLCLALRFEKSYSRQIGEWCRERNLKFTGHYLQEDKIGLSTRVNGSIMPHYTHEDIPGIDILCEKTDEYLTLKQCSSVVNQYGKEGMIAETYAATGWDFTLEGMKWIGDWEYALGVTQRCLHLSLYSMRGERKHDYPPDFHSQNPLWPLLPSLENYFSRLSYLLQQGKVIRNILFIHPAGSVWTEMGCSPYGNPVRREERDVPRLDKEGYNLNDILAYLCLRGIDCDLADETLLARDGSVKDQELHLGQANYSIVVLPRLTSLYRSSFELLKTFNAEGGHLVIMEKSPHLIEGEPDQELVSFFKDRTLKYINSSLELYHYLTLIDPPLFTLTTAEGGVCSSCVCQMRKDEDNFILFIANNERFETLHIQLTLNMKGTVYIADLFSGDINESIPHKSQIDSMVFNLDLEACGSRLFIIDTSVLPKSNRTTPQKKENTRVPLLKSAVPITLDKPNQFVLDYARFSLGEKDSYEGEGFIWLIHKEIREQLSMRQVEGGEVIQRYLWVSNPHPSDGILLKLYFDFYVETIPRGENWVSLENAQEYLIRVNGILLTDKPIPSPLSHDQEIVSFKNLVKGKNSVELSCSFRENLTLDAIFLLGSFGVSPDRKIIEEVRTLSYSDWTEQGLFHFSGSVTYNLEQEIPDHWKSVFLVHEAWEGAGLQIDCNGTKYNVLWRGQSQTDISDSIKCGLNKIEITLCGSLRNLFGPLHLEGKKRPFTNPGCFIPEGDDFSEKYNVVPYGLYGEPVLLIVN